MTDASSEFQTDGAAHRSERFDFREVGASERLDEQCRSHRA